MLALLLLLAQDEKEFAKWLAEKDEALRAKHESAIRARGLEALSGLDALESASEPVRGRARLLVHRIAAEGAEAPLPPKAEVHRVRVYLRPEGCCRGRLRGMEEARRRLRELGDVLGAHSGEALLVPDAVVFSVYIRKHAPVAVAPIRRILSGSLRHGGVGEGDVPLPDAIYEEAEVVLELLGRGDGPIFETQAGQRFEVTDGASRRAILRRRGFREPRGGGVPTPRPRSEEPLP